MLTSLGAFVTTAVLIATLAITLVLAARGSITIGDAAIAIVGLQQLSGRLQSAGTAFGSVHEGVTFLRDFESFRATLPLIPRASCDGRAPDAAEHAHRQRPALPLPGGRRRTRSTTSPSSCVAARAWRSSAPTVCKTTPPSCCAG